LGIWEEEVRGGWEVRLGVNAVKGRGGRARDRDRDNREGWGGGMCWIRMLISLFLGDGCERFLLKRKEVVV
jgi:hypothetical protein